MLLSKFKILGHSMEPTLKNGQTVLVSNFPYFFKKPKVNDMIAFRSKKEVFIKRISKINTKEVFVIGDNLKDSLDSRRMGLIKFEKILGKVIYKV